MHPKQQKRLAKKGWKKHELSHAAAMLHSSKDKLAHRNLQKSLQYQGFYILLLLLFFGSIILTVYSVPLLLLFNSQLVYWIALIAGLLVGLIFVLILSEFKQLERKHHIILLLVLLVIILMNALIMLNISRTIPNVETLAYDLDVVVLLFSVFFLVPYLYSLVKK